MNNPSAAIESGTESVWDYPRPPRIEYTSRHIRIMHGGQILADSHNACRILETSHPPVYYVPQNDLAMGMLRRSASRESFCEFKGVARYWDLVVPGLPAVRDVAWSYEKPTGHYESLKGHLAFYASRVEECWVNDELVVAQEGDFYGGWITKDVIGPFKGGVGTRGW